MTKIRIIKDGLEEKFTDERVEGFNEEVVVEWDCWNIARLRGICVHYGHDLNEFGCIPDCPEHYPFDDFRYLNRECYEG